MKVYVVYCIGKERRAFHNLVKAFATAREAAAYATWMESQHENDGQLYSYDELTLEKLVELGLPITP
jgi:hypothetical protein